VKRGNPVDVFLLPPFLTFILDIDDFQVELSLVVF
jgi:hypothetical protein